MQIAIPVDNIAFQIGETAQVHSGGYLQVNHEMLSCGEIFTHTRSGVDEVISAVQLHQAFPAHY